jgi:Domain of unknown function (DUF4389)
LSASSGAAGAKAKQKEHAMTDFNPEPRSQPEPGVAPKGSIWMRGLMMLIIGILISLAQTVLHALTVVQFVLMLINRGKPNAQIAGFGKSLGAWLAKAAVFQTAASEAKPWPFED